MRPDPILEIAMKEVSPGHYEEFAPIERGTVFASVMLLLLACVAIPFVIYRKLRPIQSDVS